jgi:hypothetical protein
MKIHVVCSPEINKERIDQLKNIFQSIKGPMEFIFISLPGNAFPKISILSFEQLFSVSKKYREKINVPQEDFVLTLTDHSNDLNYFASLDPENIHNGFVHAGEWENFISCESHLPVAFTILNIAQLGMAIHDYSEINGIVHQQSIGCLNDFCKRKNDVIFKLRTGDICSNCIDKLISRWVSPLKIEQMLRLLEAMREQMKYSMHFHLNVKPSRLRLHTGRRGNSIELTEYDCTQIELTELQMAFYLLFLKHEKGILIKELSSHREELSNFYTQTSGRTKKYFEAELKPAMEKAIRAVNGSGSEIISKINAGFIKAIGKTFSKNYIIQGDNAGAKKISLDRHYLIDSEWLLVP